MTTTRSTHRQQGLTLIEIMIVVAVIALVAGLAVPAYLGYIAESKSSAARANAEPLRLALEDYRIDNGSYSAINGQQWVPGGTQTLESGPLGWSPDGDGGLFSYSVSATTGSYTITVTYKDGTAITLTK